MARWVRVYVLQQCAFNMMHKLHNATAEIYNKSIQCCYNFVLRIIIFVPKVILTNVQFDGGHGGRDRNASGPSALENCAAIRL